MKEALLRELDLVCQRIADSTISNQLTGKPDEASAKKDKAILNKARKSLVAEVRFLIENPPRDGLALLNIVPPEQLPSKALAKLSGVVSSKLLVHNLKVSAAEVFNLIVDGKEPEAFRAIIELSRRLGVWQAYKGETERSKRGGAITGALNSKPAKKRQRIETYNRYRESACSNEAALMDAAHEIYRADNPSLSDEEIATPHFQREIQKLAGAIRKNVDEEKRQHK